MPTTTLPPRLFTAFAMTWLLVASVARSDEPAPRQNQERYEVKFLQGMIDHHSMAVITSRLCQERAIHPELMELCEGIESSQSAEIAQMQVWLEDWYGITYEPRMTKKMQRQIASLANLSGARFEIAFMEMMIEHHEAAIKEGERCVQKAYHASLIELCDNIIATQSMEVMLMEMWLDDWYYVSD